MDSSFSTVDAACWWACMGWVISYNPWLNPCPLLVITFEHVNWSQRYGRHFKCGLRQRRIWVTQPYLCLSSLYHLPHTAPGPHFPWSAFYYKCARESSCCPWCCLQVSTTAELWLFWYQSLLAQVMFPNSSFSLSLLPPPVYCLLILGAALQVPCLSIWAPHKSTHFLAYLDALGHEGGCP